MLDKLPGMQNIPDAVKGQMGDKTFIQMEAIISSMTKKERARPEIIKGSRKKRIAAGSGTQVQEKIVACAQITNVTGTRQPIEKITELAHSVGAVVVIDGAQGIVHEQLDLSASDIDFYVFSHQRKVRKSRPYDKTIKCPDARLLFLDTAAS